MSINDAAGYADSGFYTTPMKLGDVKSVTVVGSDTFGVNIWLDASTANDSPTNGKFFTWDGNGNHFASYGGDEMLSDGPVPNSGTLSITDSSTFTSYLDNQPHTLAELKTLYPNKDITFWVGTTAMNGGTHGATITAFDVVLLPVVNTNTSKRYSTIQAAIDDATAGNTISLGSDITITSEININKALTLDGQGYTLFASFTKTDNSNNSAIGIGHSDVTVKNLIEDGTDSANLHGINIYQSTGVTTEVNLNDVTVSHNGHSGVVVNGSTVTANNLNASGNGWHSVNVDKTGANFTLTGTGVLADTLQIFSDTPGFPVSAAGYTAYTITSPSGILYSNHPKAITAFTIPSQTGTTTIDETAHTIGVTMPYGTNVTALVPTVTFTGASVNPNTGVAQNFTSPVTYVVSAVDTTTQSYVVTVTVAPAPSHSSGGSSTTPAVPAKVETPDGCEAGNKFSTTTGRNCNAATPAVPAGQVLGASTQDGKVLGAEKFNFTIFVKNGSKGNEIIELQKLLTSLGYDLGIADGKFGPKTKGAVIKFQIANKLVGDGVVGAKTRALLNK